jgi:hypothetical protein
MRPLRWVLGALLLTWGAGCSDHSVSWDYLAGPWRFEAGGMSFVELFEQAPSTPLGPDEHGDQSVFPEPHGAESPAKIFSFGFRLSSGDHPSLHYSTCFGECQPSAQIQRVDDGTMIIDYDGAPRPADLGKRVTYRRASDIEVSSTGSIRSNR